jgi:enoyl-CoA hydratase
VDVEFERRGRIGIATLNRPRALNAVSLGMYRLLAPQVAAWNADPAVHAIVLRGNGRAFCAGGDVRSLYDDAALRVSFFAEEYRFIEELHVSPKPFVSLAHGFTFGGGAGLSVNAAFRVAGESMQLAMPEVFIGSIPDVGATKFLRDCPGKLGLYLAMTGARIGAGDALALGLFTHFVPEAQWPELLDALTVGGAPGDVLPRFAEPPLPSPLLARAAEIDRVFSRDSVEAMDPQVPGASPLSLKLVFEQMRRAPGLDLAGALKLEYSIIQRVLQRTEFFEGVRAVLVDKDRNPRWRYASVADVPQSEVDAHFVPLGPSELQL